MKTVRIGSGAGYSGDRIEPALDLARRGNLDFLVFECLAERTIAHAQLRRHANPAEGYDPFLDRRMRAVLRPCREGGVRIVSNMGAAHPMAAARRIGEIARDMGLGALRVAAVLGDDVLDVCRRTNLELECGRRMADLDDRIISANAYIGAAAIAEALDAGADVVVTGRAADPALFLGPLVHAFGWSMEDWDKLGKGTLAGHLLECAGQVCGGYYADPGHKDVAGLANLGFPYGDIRSDGTLELSKLPETGGCITPATVKEQLLYEIHDPARYFQPDVVADFANAAVEAVGPDRVRVSGATGRVRSGALKVSVSYHDGYIGEGHMSYAGPGAVERARLAMEIVKERLAGIALRETRFDLIGADALHGSSLSAGHQPYEVRLRAVGRGDRVEDAERIGEEIEALYTNGPAGGGGAWKACRPAVSLASALIDEALVSPSVLFLEDVPA